MVKMVYNAFRFWLTVKVACPNIFSIPGSLKLLLLFAAVPFWMK